MISPVAATGLDLPYTVSLWTEVSKVHVEGCEGASTGPYPGLHHCL